LGESKYTPPSPARRRKTAVDTRLPGYQHTIGARRPLSPDTRGPTNAPDDGGAIPR